MTTTRETVLKVEGMSCSSCVRHINGALRGIEGVVDVEVRLKEHRVLVKHGEEAPSQQLVEALHEAGYEATAA